MPENISLGKGIALGYRMPSSDVAVNLINQRRKEEQDAIDAAKQAAQKSMELQDKYRDDLDKFNVEGIIAPLQQNSKAASAAIIDHVKKGIASNPNYNPFSDDDLDVLRFDLKQITARDRVSSEAYLKDVEKGVGKPESFAIQTQWTDAVGKNDKEAWDKLTGGTGVYTYGAIEPKEEIKQIDWIKGKNDFADQTRQGAFTTEEGAQFVPDKTIKQRWDIYRTTPEYNAEITHYNTQGITDDVKADSLAFQDFKNVLGQKAAPLKKEGGLQIGIGWAKSGKFYYNLENLKSAQAGGKSAIIFGQEGGTALPFNSFVGKEGDKEIIGRPTGKIYDVGKGKNEFEVEMLVAKAQKQGFEFDITQITPETNPDKYEKVYVPLTKSDFNRKKFQGEYGGQDIDELYKGMIGEQKTTQPKEAAKTIKRSDISIKAKASGYTAKEYEKMLIDKGIEITE